MDTPEVGDKYHNRFGEPFVVEAVFTSSATEPETIVVVRYALGKSFISSPLSYFHTMYPTKILEQFKVGYRYTYPSDEPAEYYDVTYIRENQVFFVYPTGDNRWAAGMWLKKDKGKFVEVGPWKDLI